MANKASKFISMHKSEQEDFGNLVVSDPDQNEQCVTSYFRMEKYYFPLVSISF